VTDDPRLRAAYNAVTPSAPLDALMRSLDQSYTYSFWGSAYGGYANLTGGSNIGSPTAITRGGGIASGIDYRLGPNTVIGAAVGGGRTNWSVSNANGSGNSDILQVGLYGLQRLGAAYVSGSVAYAFDAFNTTRNDTVSSAVLKGSFNANGVTGRVEGGYRFGTPEIGLTPYLAGQFSWLATPAYSETAASGSPTVALTYQSQTTSNVRGEVGLSFDTRFQMQDSATLLFRARGGYAHDSWNNNFINANFLSLPVESFTMPGITPPSNLGLVSLMSEIAFRNGFSVGTKLDGEFGSKSYSLAATGTVRYSWR
jgi:outer membrane autotransporter protein